MDASPPLTEGATSSKADAAVSKVQIPQYRLPAILLVWAAAALPMGALAWLVAPALADRFSGEGGLPFAKALLISLTIGVIWQFVLVLILVGREQRTLRWSTIRERPWQPGPPRLPRLGGRSELLQRQLGLVRPRCRPVALRQRARGGTPVPRAPPTPDERRVRTGRLARERGPLRRVPPAPSLGAPCAAGRCVHHLLPHEAVPERLDRDRRAQRPERVRRGPPAHSRPLRRSVRVAKQRGAAVDGK